MSDSKPLTAKKIVEGFDRRPPGSQTRWLEKQIHAYALQECEKARERAAKIANKCSCSCAKRFPKKKSLMQVHGSDCENETGCLIADDIRALNLEEILTQPETEALR